MIWRHKITGVEIDVESTMGGDWEPVKAPGRPAHAAEQDAGKTAAPEKDVSRNGRTVRNKK